MNEAQKALLVESATLAFLASNPGSVLNRRMSSWTDLWAPKACDSDPHSDLYYVSIRLRAPRLGTGWRVFVSRADAATLTAIREAVGSALRSIYGQDWNLYHDSDHPLGPGACPICRENES